MSGRQSGAKQPVVIGIAFGLFVGILASVVVVRVSLLGEHAADTMAASTAAAETVAAGRAYPGDARAEAALVEAESERLSYVRRVSASAVWDATVATPPYRVRTGTTYTLVLTPREQPYSAPELAALAPGTFQRDPDGFFLLSENIVVLGGATLALAPEDGSDGLDIRLASDTDFFVSIVTSGGSLVVDGTETAPVSLSSWSRSTGAPDTQTTDGRAYVRVIGGRASVSHADVSDLGFWSGNTGGLALTGTDEAATFDGLLDPAPDSVSAAATATGAPVLPPGPLVVPGSPTPDALVTAGLDNLRVSGNAFGVFIANAHGVLLRDSSISDSLVDGVVFHRAVENSSIVRTESRDNGVDGFRAARSSTDVAFTAVTATGNGRDGLALDGRPLAAGPSATGTAVVDYGDSTIARGEFSHNGRYGIAVSGGSDLSIRTNEVAANLGGIVVDGDASDVTISDNRLTDQVRQSIAIRDGVRAASVADNSIAGGDTAVYVRNAGATVERNTVSRVSNHGVTLVGDAGDVTVTANVVAGFGSIPIFTEDSEGGTVAHNDTADWHPAITVATVVNAVFQPLTIVWILLALVVVGTALATRASRSTATIRHPYADRVPISAFTRGFVSRESMK